MLQYLQRKQKKNMSSQHNSNESDFKVYASSITADIYILHPVTVCQSVIGIEYQMIFSSSLQK
jgi:hypothetical protein